MNKCSKFGHCFLNKPEGHLQLVGFYLPFFQMIQNAYVHLSLKYSVRNDSIRVHKLNGYNLIKKDGLDVR